MRLLGGGQAGSLIGTAHVLDRRPGADRAATTAGTALTISAIMPYVIAGLLIVWNVAYGRHTGGAARRIAAANAARGEAAARVVNEGTRPVIPAQAPGCARMICAADRRHACQAFCFLVAGQPTKVAA
jgi:hypothetical protein